MSTDKKWWVYVLHSEKGPYYVGSTTDPARRIRQHNGELAGGARCTRANRPWHPAALYGPYKNRSEAFKAERALKKGKRGKNRTRWAPKDSEFCRGLGPEDPWVSSTRASGDARASTHAGCRLPAESSPGPGP